MTGAGVMPNALDRLPLGYDMTGRLEEEPDNALLQVLEMARREGDERIVGITVDESR